MVRKSTLMLSDPCVIGELPSGVLVAPLLDGVTSEGLAFSLASSKSNTGAAIGGNEKLDPLATVEVVVLNSEGSG